MVVAYMLFGAMVGALPILIAMGMNQFPSNLIGAVAAMGGLIGGVIGAMVGSERAFTLRLLAQQALCQVQIERNTRAAAMGMPPARTAQPPPIPRG